MHKETRWILYAVLLWAIGAMLYLERAHSAGFYLPEVGSPASLGTGGVANPTNTFGADAAWTNPAGMTGLMEHFEYLTAGEWFVTPFMGRQGVLSVSLYQESKS